MVDGLNRFSQNIFFLKNAGGLLSTVAAHTSGTRQLLGRGAVSSILSALASHPDSPSLVVKFVHTLLNMIIVEVSVCVCVHACL